MSASLVGSEMCIRDRPRDEPPGLGGCLCGAGAPPASGCSCAPRAQSRRPVSYTHLTLPTICSV
eukprot:14776045-Alexandrium_andersonii.AAC.1